MTPQDEVDYIVHDCLFAIGQSVGRAKGADYSAIEWWRNRYRQRFLHAMTSHGAVWARDRQHVTAVARFLGLRAAHHARNRRTIDRRSAERASAEVERGCRLRAERDATSSNALPSPLRVASSIDVTRTGKGANHEQF